MKLGLFGGTFDPIHRGHVDPVRRAREVAGLERVLYLPTARPPHKPDHDPAPPWARFTMVELALLDEVELHVSAHELTPGRPAYTVETLEHFHRERPDDELHLILGEDSLARLTSWRRWRDLVRRARLVVLGRSDGSPKDAYEELPDELRDALFEGGGAPAPPIAVECALTEDVSATEIRRRLARGERPPAGWLHPRVVDYIQKYTLYR